MFDIDLVVDREKIVDYLMSERHSFGRAKFHFFWSFGFRAASWQILQDALITQARANAVTSQIESEYGTKFVIDGPIPSPDGRNPEIRSIWIRRHDESFVRFVTAYPVRGKSDDQRT